MVTTNITQSQRTTLYIPADFFQIRAPALPAHTFQQLSMAHLVEPAHSDDLDTMLQRQNRATRQFLLDKSADPQIEQAIAVASSSLYEGIMRLRHGEITGKQTRRLSSSLLRYLIRMSTRPTPFGLFSGIALGSFGTKTTIQLGTPSIERFRTRPDMGWLLTLLKDLEASPSLVEQITVQINQLASIAGGRVYLPQRAIYGQKQNQALSLRATPIVRKVFDLAREPLPYLALYDALRQAFPAASREQIKRLLWQLWEHGLLLSTLHPSLTNAQPARHLSQQIERLQGVEETHQLLDNILMASTELDNEGIGGSLEPLTRLTAIERPIPGPKHQSLIQIDSLLSLTSSNLHATIGVAAAHAAELLLRVTPFPQGSPALQEYRHQFIEKYGLNAEVPLLELLRPESGLDAPAGYTQPPRTYKKSVSNSHSHQTRRESVLHMLVQNALNSHCLEVELAEVHLAALETWSPNLKQAPRTLEMYLQIQATSREDLDNGKFCAVISPNPGALNAGRSFGRFFDLLGKPGICALRELLACEEALEPEAIFAELSYQHMHARALNTAIRPGLRAYEIAVNTTPSVSPERVIHLDDLAVGVEEDHFYLRSRSLNKRVIVSQLHMLTVAQAPNVCRFIAEIASDGLPALSSFDWGNLSRAPFLPRMTVPHGSDAKIILTPALWNLQTTTIQPQGEGSLEARRFAGLQRWRSTWRVPRYVYLSEYDNRLLLDLEHPLMAAELFKELATLKGDQMLMLQEVLPDFEHLWLTDTQNLPYFSEIVVPLLRRDAFTAQMPVTHQSAHSMPSFFVTNPNSTGFLNSRVASQDVRVFYPGDTWNYTKLYCTPVQQDEIIAGPMRELIHLLRDHSLIDRWFFLRYADPQPHLRLRIHTPVSEQIQFALHQLLSWSRNLAERGLVQYYTLDTYEREVARYGGPTSIDIIEHVFSIDSDLCSNLLAAHYTHQLSLDPFIIAVVSLDCFFSAWGYDLNRRLQWLRERTKKNAWKSEFHTKRKQVDELIAPWARQADAEGTAQRHLLDRLTHALTDRLPPLAMNVRDLARVHQLWTTEDELLASLAHLHTIRLLNVDARKEQQVYAFWRATLESIQRRPIHKEV